MNSHLIVYVCVLCLFLLALKFQISRESFIRNLGILSYSRYYMAGNNPNDLKIALTLIKQAVAMTPSNPISRARLASIYISANNNGTAIQEAQLAMTLAGYPMGSCQMGQTNTIKMLSRLTNYQPTTLLDFSHPLSVWHFDLNNGAIGSISMVDKLNGIPDCVASLKVDIDLLPNRYAILAQNIQLKPNLHYQLSVLIKSEGICKAWLGIRSQWPGIQVPSSVNWQPVIFGFYTDDKPQPDFVYIVVEQGHGTLSIRNIQLKEEKEP